jgi:hypothetical protein
MSENIIPNSEAELLLHRYVTERVPILAWFVSADKSVRVKLTGFVSCASLEEGLELTSEWPVPGTPLSAFLVCSGVDGSWCEYSDETELPVDFKFGSGLRCNMPNGDTLTILERKPVKE